MIDIIQVLLWLSQCVDKTTLSQLSRIVSALLAMTGRVTMLGISRWTAFLWQNLHTNAATATGRSIAKL